MPRDIADAFICSYKIVIGNSGFVFFISTSHFIKFEGTVLKLGCFHLIMYERAIRGV